MLVISVKQVLSKIRQLYWHCQWLHGNSTIIWPNNATTMLHHAAFTFNAFIQSIACIQCCLRCLHPMLPSLLASYAILDQVRWQWMHKPLTLCWSTYLHLPSDCQRPSLKADATEKLPAADNAYSSLTRQFGLYEWLPLSYHLPRYYQAPYRKARYPRMPTDTNRCFQMPSNASRCFQMPQGLGHIFRDHVNVFVVLLYLAWHFHHNWMLIWERED